MLYKRFAEVIRKNGFINDGDTVLVAVSGGADSVCLFHLLIRYIETCSFRLCCAHVNHMLREEACEDASFVENLCNKFSIPFYLHEENVEEYAKRNKISTELAGRNIRYAFFDSLKCDVIMTAHNKNDVAESMLLHFVRGTGVEGLCGIPSNRNQKICRPLLSFSRKEILEYLQTHNLTWKEDKSNTDIIFTRNKIRHKIIPILEEINPSFLDAAYRTAEILSDENHFVVNNTPFDSVIKKSNNSVRLSVDALNSLPIALQRRVVHSLVDDYADVCTFLSLLNAKNGTTVSLGNHKKASKEYDFITLYEDKVTIVPSEIPLPSEGSIVFGEYLFTVGEGTWRFPKGTYTIRTRRKGDYFYPEGMEGRKKVKDFFIDSKIPKRLRDQIPLLTQNGEIATIANLRRSKKFIAQTEQYINIKIEPIKGA